MNDDGARRADPRRREPARRARGAHAQHDARRALPDRRARSSCWKLIPGPEAHGRVDGNARRPSAGSGPARRRLLPPDAHALSSAGRGHAADRTASGTCLRRRRTIRAVPDAHVVPTAYGRAAVAGVARRGRAREARRRARAGDGGRADELGRRVGAAPARVGRARFGERGGPRRRRRDVPHRVPPRGVARRARSSRPRVAVRCRLPWSRRRCGARSRVAGPVRAGRATSRHRGSARRRAPRARRPRPRAARRARRATSAGARGRAAAPLGQVAPRARVVRRARPHAGRDRRGAGPGSPLVRELGTVVCFLPQRWSTPAAALLRALAEQTDARDHRRADRLGCGRRADRREPAARRRGDRRAGPASGHRAGRRHRGVERLRPRRRGRARSCAASSTRCAPAFRSNAWRCCTRPTSRTRGCCTSTSTSPTSRTTARRPDRCRSPCSGAVSCELFALADTDFARDDVCGLFASAPVLDGRGRSVPAAQVGTALARRRGRARRRRSGARASTRTRRSFADDERGDAERGAGRSARRVRRGPGRRSRSGAAARARGAGSRSSRTGSCAGSSAPRRAARRGRRSRQVAARRVEAVLDRLGTLDAIDPGADDRRASGARSSSSSTRRAIGSAGSATVCSSARSAWRSVSTSTGCGCAGWPRACSRRSRTTIRCSATASGPRSAASCGCAPIAPPTTSARCSRRSRRPSGARVCTYPRGDLRRSTEHVPSRFLAATLAARRRRRAFDPVVRARARPTSRSPRTGTSSSVRAAVAGESWVESRARGRAGLELTRARAGSRVHPLRRQPRAPRRSAARDQPAPPRTG